MTYFSIQLGVFIVGLVFLFLAYRRFVHTAINNGQELECPMTSTCRRYKVHNTFIALFLLTAVEILVLRQAWQSALILAAVGCLFGLIMKFAPEP